MPNQHLNRCREYLIIIINLSKQCNFDRTRSNLGILGTGLDSSKFGQSRIDIKLYFRTIIIGENQ